MNAIPLTMFDLAQRFVGIQEIAGAQHQPFVQWCHSLVALGTDQPDETPWCSSFTNAMAWILRLPRSKSAMARSWLNVGTPIGLHDATPGFDVVVFWRGSKDAATGHVGLYAGVERRDGKEVILVLGGNQGDSVSIAPYPADRLLGVRRLRDAA